MLQSISIDHPSLNGLVLDKTEISGTPSSNTKVFLKALGLFVAGAVLPIIIATAQAGSLIFPWTSIATTAIAAAGIFLLGKINATKQVTLTFKKPKNA